MSLNILNNILEKNYENLIF